MGRWRGLTMLGLFALCFSAFIFYPVISTKESPPTTEQFSTTTNTTYVAPECTENNRQALNWVAFIFGGPGVFTFGTLAWLCLIGFMVCRESINRRIWEFRKSGRVVAMTRRGRITSPPDVGNPDSTIQRMQSNSFVDTDIIYTGWYEAWRIMSGVFIAFTFASILISSLIRIADKHLYECNGLGDRITLLHGVSVLLAVVAVVALSVMLYVRHYYTWYDEYKSATNRHHFGQFVNTSDTGDVIYVYDNANTELKNINKV